MQPVGTVNVVNNYKRFVHKECEYYPCHNSQNLNCLFCFCPLYSLSDCGGKYIILDNELKDCSLCDIPHCDIGYDYIIGRLKQENRKLVSHEDNTN